VIGSTIAGRKIAEERLIKKDLDDIRRFVTSIPREELEKSLLSLLQMLVKHGYDDNVMLYEYLREDIKSLSFELINAAEHDCLSAIFC